MKTAIIIISIICAGLLIAHNTPCQNAYSSLPWHPKVSQPIQQLEETLAKLEQQQPKNYTISNITFLYDAKLYILFHKYILILPEALRKKEIEEQRRWLQEREKIVNIAYSEYEGGTLASFTAGNASKDATRLRISQIEKKINFQRIKDKLFSEE